jgi:hypothetical protein
LPVVGPPKSCILYGDPHLITFDGARADYYSQGEYWVVKSDTVQIQGRYMPTVYTHGLSVTKELMIGGPFLGGHKLRISAKAASWDGQPILASLPSQWSNAQPPVSIQYNDQGGLVDATLTPNEPMKIVHLSLPLGITMQINRWVSNKDGDYINVKITMQKQPNQDGHCGNFNGNVADDARTQVRARLGKTGVPQSELLFGSKTPVVVANRPDLSNCPEDTMAQAKDLCSKKGGESAECLIDVCFGGPKFATQ